MQGITDVIVQALRIGGAIIRDAYASGASEHVRHKGAVNLVTETDIRSEEAVVAFLARECPGWRIVAEESATMGKWDEAKIDAAENPSGLTWYLDPLDGTTNFAHGFPVFCISLGLADGADLIVGGVYQPLLEETFIAEKGKGATLNGSPIHVSPLVELDKALLATGFPYDIRDTDETNLDYFAAFAVKAQAIRRAGSAALDLSYLAAGRFDGFWEMKLAPWDTAAGTLIIREAGGVVTDFGGRPFVPGGAEALAAGTPDLAAALQRVIADVRAARKRP